MSPFDDIDLERLLSASEWTEAHECFREQTTSKRPYEDLYEVIPLWLYARSCLEREKEEECRVEDQDASSPSSQPPVNRLPRTILALIFERLRDHYVSSLFFHSSVSEPGQTSSDLTENPDRATDPYAWISVTLVCRHWRNTAYSHPLLWSYIDLAYPREVIRSLLILSQDASLYVRIHPSDRTLRSRPKAFKVKEIGEFEIKMELILDERRRIEEMGLRLEDPKFARLVPWKEFAAAHSPWSRLTTLILIGPSSPQLNGANEGEQETYLQLLPGLTEQAFPRLRNLTLVRLVPDWKESSLPRLERLEIRNIGRDSNSDSDTTSSSHGCEVSL